MKKFEEMNRDERRMSEIARRLYLPLHQFEIYKELSYCEQEVLDVGIAEDIEKYRQHALENNLPFDVTKSESEWLYGNGYRNLLRLAELREMLPTELVLQLAMKLGLVSGQAEHDHLLKEFVGEECVQPRVFIKYMNNCLLINGREVCRARKTSKLHYILFSFDEVNWQKKLIDFGARYEAKQISDAVLALNRKQNAIRFSVVDYTSVEFGMRDANLARTSSEAR